MAITEHILYMDKQELGKHIRWGYLIELKGEILVLYPNQLILF
jgi:hypothetical protein